MKRKKFYIFMIRWFDDSIVELKEKYLNFYDSTNRSTIRRFDRRYKRKKIIFLWFDDSTIRSSIWKKKILYFHDLIIRSMIRRFDRLFDDLIDDSTIRSMIRRFDRWFDDSIVFLKVKIIQNLFWSIRRFNHRIDFWKCIAHRCI